MTQETLNQLTKLCEIDAMFINTSFGASEELGIAAIEESISSFTIFLKNQAVILHPMRPQQGW